MMDIMIPFWTKENKLPRFLVLSISLVTSSECGIMLSVSLNDCGGGISGFERVRDIHASGKE
jgi:hypothetical protein